MVDGDILKYIEDNLKAGYSVLSIEKELTREGYSSKNILAAVEHVINKNTAHTAHPPRNSKEVMIFGIVIICAVICGVIGITLMFTIAPKSISETDFANGISFDLKENKEAEFTFDEEIHTITTESVSENSATLILQSDPIRVDIKVGEIKKVDINNDGYYDVQIELKNIIDNIPNYHIKKIYESSCVENWACEEWYECQSSGVQYRDCVDVNLCPTEKDKPNLQQSCEYKKPESKKCVESWDCGNWEECTAKNIQYRDCVDINSCGTKVGRPTLSKECEYEAPVCIEDWVCSDWSAPDGNNMQDRTCQDKNRCGTKKYMPVVVQDISCKEDWSCEDWGSCNGTIQFRTCIDNNDCNSTNFIPKLNQSCKITEIGDTEFKVEDGCIEDWDCEDWSKCVQGMQSRICKENNNCIAMNYVQNQTKACKMEKTDCGAGLFVEGEENDLESYNCFVEAAKTCRESKMNHRVIWGYIGSTIDVTRHMELLGYEKDLCVYYEKIESYSAKSTPENVLLRLGLGVSLEEIEQEDQEFNNTQQQLVGKHRECRIGTDDLVDNLVSLYDENVEAQGIEVAGSCTAFE